MTGNIAFLGMAIVSTTGSTTYGVVPPRVISVLAAMAGFAGGIYLATKIVRRFEPSAANKNQQPTGVVWPRQTTLALSISLLAHLCFVLIWFATSARPGASVIPVLLATWALAMGMQSAAVRQLDVPGIGFVDGRLASGGRSGSFAPGRLPSRPTAAPWPRATPKAR